MAKRVKKSPMVEKAIQKIAKKHGIPAKHARAMIEIAAKANLAAAKQRQMQAMQQRAMQQRAMQQRAMQMQQRPPMPPQGMQRPPMPGGM